MSWRLTPSPFRSTIPPSFDYLNTEPPNINISSVAHYASRNKHHELENDPWLGFVFGRSLLSSSKLGLFNDSAYFRHASWNSNWVFRKRRWKLRISWNGRKWKQRNAQTGADVMSNNIDAPWPMTVGYPGKCWPPAITISALSCNLKSLQRSAFDKIFIRRSWIHLA